MRRKNLSVMNSELNNESILDLLWKYENERVLTNEELDQLRTWREEKKEHELLFIRLRKRDVWSRERIQENLIEMEKPGR